MLACIHLYYNFLAFCKNSVLFIQEKEALRNDRFKTYGTHTCMFWLACLSFVVFCFIQSFFALFK